MQVQMILSPAAAEAVCGLIHEYLAQGGKGHDDDALAEALTVIGSADRILIADPETGESG